VLSERLCSLVGHQHPLAAVALAENAIITADQSCNLRCWDMESMLCCDEFCISPDALPSGGATLGALIAPPPAPTKNSRLVVLAGGRLHSFCAAEQCTVEPQTAVAFSSRFMRVVGASECSLHIWEASTGARVSTFRNLASTPVSAICLDHTHRNCVVGEHSGALALFNLSTGGKVRDLPRHSRGIVAVELVANWSAGAATKVGRCDSDALLVSIAAGDDRLQVCSLREGLLTGFCRVSEGECCSLATSPTRGLIAAATASGFLQIWRLHPDSGLRDHSVCGGLCVEVTALQFVCNEGSRLVSADADAQLVLWQVLHGKSVPLKCWATAKSGLPAAPTSLAYDTRAKTLVCGDEDGRISTWDLSDLACPSSSARAPLSPGVSRRSGATQAPGTSRGAGIRINSSGDAARNAIDAVTTGVAPKSSWRGHEDGVNGVSLIPHGALDASRLWSNTDAAHGPETMPPEQEFLLLSASADGSAKAWAASGRCLGVLSRNESNVCWSVPLDLSTWRATVTGGHEELLRALATYEPPSCIATANDDPHLLERFKTDAPSEKDATVLQNSLRLSRRACTAPVQLCR
jgi:WD40 repeat protein